VELMGPEGCSHLTGNSFPASGLAAHTIHIMVRLSLPLRVFLRRNERERSLDLRRGRQGRCGKNPAPGFCLEASESDLLGVSREDQTSDLLLFQEVFIL